MRVVTPGRRFLREATESDCFRSREKSPETIGPSSFALSWVTKHCCRKRQRRVSQIVHSWRTLLVLTSTHKAFYSDEVAGIPSSRLLVQPSNKGTAPAILYSVMRLRELDPKGVVAFFPSDHHFSDDEAFMGHIDSAYAAAESWPDVVILLGISPETPESEYGWIEPGVPLGSPAPDSFCRVSRFWEKPSISLASSLMERGCLWNSFVMVGHVHAFLMLLGNALPGLVEAFESIRSSFFTEREKAALCEVYFRIRSTNFSQDVLSGQPNGLAVLRATGLGWSDLGEPGRVHSVMERKRVRRQPEFDSGYGSG